MNDEQTRVVLALEMRLTEFADLCCQNPLDGDMGDVAYDLLRKAAAEIASLRLRIALCPARYSMHGCPTSSAELAKQKEDGE